MNKVAMSCWICGDNATTGEHRIKHSDLKQLYPNTTQQSPLYHRRDGSKQETIGGLKSNRLKFDALLCAKCNNERTQKFDHAWEMLSDYLQKNWDTILKDGQINLLDVFPKDTEKNMVHVQLFFVKIFSCKIEESGAHMSLVSFSKALLSKAEHPALYFSIRDSHISSSGNYSSLSDIEIFSDKYGDVVYAHMFYTIGQTTIDLIYCPNEKYADFIDFNGAEKPSQITQGILKLSVISYSSVLPKYVQSLMKD